MRGEAHPIVLDTHYSDAAGTLLPDFQGVTVRDFRYIAGGRYGAGTSVLRGYRASGVDLPVGVTFDTVAFEGGVPKVTGGGKDAPVPVAARVTFAGPNDLAAVIKPSAADGVGVTFLERRVSGPDALSCAGVFQPMRTAMADSPI
jgi:polygalacturonase